MVQFTERKRRYLLNHGITLLRFLWPGIARLEVDDGDLEVNENVSP